MAESFGTLSYAERYTAPHVETLVYSVYPERQAFTIDGITLPDFDALATNDFEIKPEYILIPDSSQELGIACSRSDENPVPFAGSESLEAWMKESLLGLGIAVPEIGLRMALMSYLDAEKRASEPMLWHKEIGVKGEYLGALSLFQKDPTEIMARPIQDVYPGEMRLERNRAFTGFRDEELAAMIGVPVDTIPGYIKRANPGQTVYVGRDALHRRPALAKGAMRNGVICFIDLNEPAYSEDSEE